MKITYINDQLLPSTDTDTEQILHNISAIGRAGADVRLVLPRQWGKPPVDSKTLADYYQVEPTFTVDTVDSVFRTTRAVEKVAHPVATLLRPDRVKDADVVYTRNLPTVVTCLAQGKRPVIYETFRPWPDQIKSLVPVFRWMNRHPRFLGAILHSDFASQSYRRIGVAPEKLLVAHNGYNPERMQPVLDKRDARRHCGLPEEGRVVTYTGHVNPQKGLLLVLDMAEALPDVRFVIVGSLGRGPVEIRAEKMPNVVIVPWQDFRQTTPYLYAADCLLIPPTTGPLHKVGNTVLPIKTFLYLATGRPIFGPKSEDLAEILSDGENACLVTPDRLDESISRLRRLLGDDTELERLGARALQDAADRTWDSRARLILDFIEQRLSR